ncbi:MAG: 3-oxoacyl-ACP reductase family protein [Candidatus Thermoplasmatota archaeon]|nr:3-oxoacyl-ACP reductase family protein [Candidatus Thermoplasmatota archaeon]
MEMLNDKVILISGASRGIGRATAVLAAENHAKVVINYYKSETAASNLVDKITKNGFSAMMIKADVSKEDEVKEMFRIIKKKYGKLDILVNNAGIIKNNLLMMTPTAEFDEIIRVNCKAPFLCMRTAVKMMMRQKSGKIINISSIVGINGTRGMTAYSASKSFLIGLTKSAAKELGLFGITVNAIAPGLIDTDLTKDLKDETKEESIKNISLGRIGTPEDIAKVILFLSSGLGDYVSGQVIGVDGCQIM